MAELKRILMVEDDSDVQAVARLALEAVGGYEVCVCSNGEEALRAVGQFHPDLLLLDVMMPGMDGPTLLGRLREQPALARVPAVFMTAKAQAHEVSGYRAMGADVVIKPFDPLELPRQLARIWAKSCPAEPVSD